MMIIDQIKNVFLVMFKMQIRSNWEIKVMILSDSLYTWKYFFI